MNPISSESSVVNWGIFMANLHSIYMESKQNAPMKMDCFMT